MNTLYYGNGNCSIEGDVQHITIAYRGSIEVTSKMPEDYKIIVGKRVILIGAGTKNRLHDLFDYEGEFKILSVRATTVTETVPCSIKKVMDYSELLDTKAEDLTVKSEDLSAGYTHGRKIRKTIIRQKTASVARTGGY